MRMHWWRQVPPDFPGSPKTLQHPVHTPGAPSRARSADPQHDLQTAHTRESFSFVLGADAPRAVFAGDVLLIRGSGRTEDEYVPIMNSLVLPRPIYRGPPVSRESKVSIDRKVNRIPIAATGGAALGCASSLEAGFQGASC